MALDGTSGYSHQTVPHYSQISSFASLHCAHILLLFFLFHLSTTYEFILVVPGASGCLELSQEWPQECYALPMPCGTRQGSSQACSPPRP